MLRRLLATTAAAALSAGAVVALAPTAQAAGSCTLTAPSKVAIYAPYQGVTLRASGACTTDYGFGAWSLINPTYGAIDGAFFDAESTQTWDVYDDVPLGRDTWRPEGAFDGDFNELAQNTPVTEIRVGSWSTVSATRSGSIVTLNTRAMRYATSLDKSIPWAGAVGQIQYRVPGTTTWLGLKNVTSTSSGTYSYRYTTSQVRDYRVVINGTSTIWPYTSATIRK